MGAPDYSAKQTASAASRFTIVAVGSAGLKITRPISESNTSDAKLVLVDTDADALLTCECERKLHLKADMIDGAVSERTPESVRRAGEKSKNEIASSFDGSKIALLVGGLGGATATGALPLIAAAARASGAFTVAFVTTPFDFEGRQRQLFAEQGLRDLKPCTDLLVAISNQESLQRVRGNAPLSEALRVGDGVFNTFVRAIANLMGGEKLLDFNFEDVRRVMMGAGKVIVAFGEGDGDKRVEAALTAMHDHDSAFGLKYLPEARRVLVHVGGGHDLPTHDIEEAMLCIRKMVHRNVDIRLSVGLNNAQANRLCVSLFGLAPAAEVRDGATSPEAEHATTNQTPVEKNLAHDTFAQPSPGVASTHRKQAEAGAIDEDTKSPDQKRGEKEPTRSKVSVFTLKRDRLVDAVPTAPVQSSVVQIKKPPVIAVVSILENTGKTLLSRHLAHQAEVAGAGPSVIVEVSPSSKGGPDGPVHIGAVAKVPLFESTFVRLADDVDQLRSSDILANILVDASPATSEDLDRVVAAVDAVVIPTRPIEKQLEAVGPVVAAAERHARPFVMVINGASGDGSSNARVAMALAQHGALCPVIVPLNDTLADGAAGNPTEMSLQGPAAGYMARLWEYLAKRFAAKVDVAAKPPQELPKGAERRKYPRWDFDWPVKVISNGNAFVTTIQNISGGGVLLQHASELVVGQWTQLEIEHLGTFEAEVVHSRNGSAGLKFLLDGARQYKLAKHLASIVERAKTIPVDQLRKSSIERKAS